MCYSVVIPFRTAILNPILLERQSLAKRLRPRSRVSKPAASFILQFCNKRFHLGDFLTLRLNNSVRQFLNPGIRNLGTFTR